MKNEIAGILTLSITGAIFTGLVQATPSEEQTPGKHTMERHTNYEYTPENGKQLSLQEAIALAQTQRGGEVREAEMEYKRGRKVFEVEGVDGEGRRYEMYLDASDGTVIKQEYQ
jgi:uncharacterized membrane protein YkoI